MQIPHITLPIINWDAVFVIMPIAIATIPESIAHIYQLVIYVNKLFDKLGLNLIGDGIGDIVTGFIGGQAGTTIVRTTPLWPMSENFSVGVLVAAAVITMIISFFTPLINLVYSLPKPVIGCLEIYLFKAIAAQGFAIFMDKKVDMFVLET